MSLPKSFQPDWAGPNEWAAMYRACGIQVVPAHMPNPNGEWKFPKLTEWTKFQNEMVPDIAFNRWYGPEGEYRNHHNVGLLTGLASGNVFVIDLDEYKDAGALQWWRGVLEVHNNGMEVETCQQLTGGGGRQLFYRARPDWRAPTNRTPIGVDIRGQGGFAIMPPSLHLSGKNYEWKDGCAPWEMEIAEAPEWLLEAVTDLIKKHGGNTSQHAPAERREHTGADLNAFGLRVDGREEYMTRLVWAAVVNWYMECPIQPTEAESQVRMREAWAVYERKTKTRLTGNENAAGLEQEGRGPTLFAEKWRRAMGKWQGDIARAAAQPIEQDEWRAATAPVIQQPADPPATGLEVNPIWVGDLSGEPKKREWIVPDWIPKGVVSSLSGDGGMGKTLIAQQLLYAAGTGGKWLGIQLEGGEIIRGLGVFCEDDEDELHRRHNSIKADLGYAIGNPFTDTWIWPRVGFDNLLVTFDREGRPLVSPFFAHIMRHVLEKKIGLLVLDTIADLFGGNEIIRAQVNYFIKATCGAFIKVAKENGFVLTVLILSHPSQAGRSSGSGESGSTAWNNAVRARLYLTRPDDGLPEQRVLTRKKSNYSASGDDVKLDLLWADGVLKPAASSNAVAVKSVENQIIQMVGIAWDEDRPYHARKGEGLRFLDSEMVAFFGDRVPVGVIISAINNLKNSGAIEAQRSGKKRGYKVRN
jgi:hypothetical protein